MCSRIYFAHIRQLRYEGEVDFAEAGHLTEAGDLDIYAIVKALVENGFDGYVRPDHGRNIWGEDGKARLRAVRPRSRRGVSQRTLRSDRKIAAGLTVPPNREYKEYEIAVSSRSERQGLRP